MMMYIVRLLSGASCGVSGPVAAALMTMPPSSASFQLGLRNFRNSHGGSSPSSTVPARISPT